MMTQDGVPIDAVVIGRNEGARLLACLQSLAGQVRRLVYVDSGSTDGSVKAAQAAGAEVVVLDMEQPFTAARARNAGLAVLADNPPEFVQLVDAIPIFRVIERHQHLVLRRRLDSTKVVTLAESERLP